jgi:hypothetical protein
MPNKVGIYFRNVHNQSFQHLNERNLNLQDFLRLYLEKFSFGECLPDIGPMITLRMKGRLSEDTLTDTVR